MPSTRIFNISNWSIRQKVAIAPVIAIAVLCTLAIFGWSVIDDQRGQMSGIYKELVTRKDRALRLPHKLGQVRTELYKLTVS